MSFNSLFIGLQDRIDTSIPLIMVNFVGDTIHKNNTQAFDPKLNSLTPACLRRIYTTALTDCPGIHPFLHELGQEIAKNGPDKLHLFAVGWETTLKELNAWAVVMESNGLLKQIGKTVDELFFQKESHPMWEETFKAEMI